MPHSRIDDILNKLHDLQKELEAEIQQLLAKKRELFRYSVEQGGIKFDQGVQALQRLQKTGVWQYLRGARLGHVLSAPIIYSVFIPLVFLDLVVTIYQHSCFRIYGIPRVQRKDYMIFDRQYLPYLNIIEKVHCVFCGYANGLIAYVREIIARTEQYWCPIKHAHKTKDPHRLEQGFLDYGDAEDYQNRLQNLQNDIADMDKEDLNVSQKQTNKHIDTD